jgi:hypothetical protein
MARSQALSPLKRAVVALLVGAVAGAIAALVVPRNRGDGPPGRPEGLAAGAPSR